MATYPPRFSRKVPFALSESQQKAFLSAIKNNPKVRTDLETVLGIEDMLSLTLQEQIDALRSYYDVGHGVALVAQIARAHHDLEEVARDIRQELSREDKIALLEEELAQEKERRERAERTIDLLDREAIEMLRKGRK